MPGLQHAGDVGVVHQGQGLPLGLEPGDDLPGVHPGLDELDGHQPLDRLGLLGHPDRAHAAFADLLNQLVGADDRAGGFGHLFVGPCLLVSHCGSVERPLADGLGL